MGISYIDAKIIDEVDGRHYNPNSLIKEGVFYRVKEELKGNKSWERYLSNKFYFEPPESHYSYRGDFYSYEKGLYYEHKGGVLKDSDSKRGRNKSYDMLELKFSNVYEKMFVEFIKKEFDLIIEDCKNLKAGTISEELIIARYSGEFQRSTLVDMNYYIDRCRTLLKRKSDYSPKSRCIKDGITLTYYCDLLCMVNLRTYPNIIVSCGDAYAFFNLTNYRLFVSYIGFGGFKMRFFYGRQTTNTPNGYYKTEIVNEDTTDQCMFEGDHEKLVNPNSYLDSIRVYCGHVYPEIVELMRVLYLKDVKSEIKSVNAGTTLWHYDFNDIFKTTWISVYSGKYNFLTDCIKDFIYKDPVPSEQTQIHFE
jgi:hypothetical protein